MVLKTLFIVVAFCLYGCASNRATMEDAEDTFSFALIGDMPYYPQDMGKFERMMDDINEQDDIHWVLHVGDIKTGDSPCSDAYLASRLQLFEQFRHPFIMVPGDNEWTDCHREGAGQYKPLERLAKLRSLFYANPGTSLGQKTLRVETQAADPAYAEFPEHVRWVEQGVVFAGLHIVGSQNGLLPFAGRTEEDDHETARRMAAAIAWMQAAFAEAHRIDSPGIFIMIHANPQFSAGPASDAFRAFLDALEEESIKFEKPVLLAHGDSHYFRIDKPLINAASKQRIANFTRVEVFGAGDVHWLRITVNPADKNVFGIRQEIMPDNSMGNR